MKLSIWQLRKNKIIDISIVLFFVLPIMLIGIFDYTKLLNNLTQNVLERRTAIAQLSATNIKSKFDHIIDVGVAFATRVKFRQFINVGKWDKAINILKDVPKNFPFIEVIALSDPGGTIKAVFPEMPEALGMDFSYRDWYKGVINSWKPYVSNVYTTTLEPRHNTVAVAIPIIGEDGKKLGILMIRLKEEFFTEWVRSLNIGESLYIRFIDRVGHFVFHENYSPFGQIMGLPDFSPVKKVLQGKTGIDIEYGPSKKDGRITAYAPVPGYGWGVILEEPEKTAFALLYSELRGTLLFYGIIFFLNLVAALALLYVMHKRRYAEYEVRKLNDELEDRIVKRTKQLEDSQKEWMSIFEAIGQPSVILDPAHGIIAANRAVCHMTGFSKEDLLGKQCYHIFHKADSSHPSEGCPMEALLLSGRFESVAMEIEALEGVFLVSCTPVLNDSGDICKIIHIATDITARKRAEDALLSSLREKELLLQEIHHRVKNNLQIISSLIMLESEDKREKNTNIVLEEIGNRVRAMSLIHEKLYQSEDIASINMKDYINELTGRLISSYTNQFGKIQVRMNVEDIFFSIEIAIPFGLILNELITNAIKYAFPEEREGIITIELKRVDQSSPLPGFITQNPDSEISVKQVIFSVSDNGIGIPADMDIHTADTLGLRLVYILGELQLKGKVSIDRTGGAAFHITFPGGSHE